MNPEIQQELLQILQSLRANSPEVFNQLMQARVDYLTACMITTISAGIGFFTILGSIAYRNREECDRIPFILSTTFAGLSLISIIAGLTYIPAIVSPLGSLISGLVK